MKTRSDFVSNSSSSSYILAVDFHKYDFDLFVKTVCDNCEDKNEPNKEVRGRNEAILRYCLGFNELLFLGTLVDGRKKETYRRGYTYGGEKASPSELRYTPFQYAMEEYEERKNGQWYADPDVEIRVIDENTVEYEYSNEIGSRMTVPRLYMESAIRDKYSIKKASASKRKERVKRILETVRRETKDDDLWRSPFAANTYCITQSTIDNTRDMLAEGLVLKFDSWEENLDMLEARIKAGETVFRTECGDAGEGEDDTRLFSFNSQYPFDGVPVESIGRDC